MKQTIRLTESELKHLIRESVKRVLSEGDNDFEASKYQGKWAVFDKVSRTYSNIGIGRKEAVKKAAELNNMGFEEKHKASNENESELHRIIRESVKRVLNEQRVNTSEKYRTYKEVEDAVYAWLEEKYPEGWANDGQPHQIEALRALGFVDDGYDQYGARAFTNGAVRVTVWYNRGDDYWDMEKAQGRSHITDNFYNSSDEMEDYS